MMKFLVALTLFLIGMFVWNTPIEAQTPTETTRFGLPSDSVELTASRTQDRKVFRLANGQVSIIFQRGLHYQRTDGRWVEPTLQFGGSKTAETLAFVMESDLVIIGPQGKSITWKLPQQPLDVAGDLVYQDRSATWTYKKRNGGVKLEGVVPTLRGLQTYTFPFRAASPLAIGKNGVIEGDGFAIAPPFISDSNGKILTANWVLGNSQLEVTFDDAGLTPPYIIDPTTNFDVAAGTDDGHTIGTDSSYPPACDSATTSIAGIELIKGQSAGPTFEIRVGLTRWDTSSLPDTALVTSATLTSPTVTIINDSDARNVIGEWYDSSNWPIDCGDHTASVGSDAFSVDLTSWASPITMGGLTGISLTGQTGLRMGISGGSPSGLNQASIGTFEQGGGDIPRLSVTYTEMAVTGITGSEVAANGLKSFDIGGAALTGVTSVRLEKSGESNINCTSIVVNDSTSVDFDCTLTGVAGGLWDVVAVKPAGSATGSALLDINVLGVTGVSPTSASPADGVAALTLAGDGFDTGAQVTLEKSGESDVVCTGEAVASFISMSANCDLTGVASGFWDVVSTNTDTTAATLSSGFFASATVTLQATGLTSGEKTLRIVGDDDGIFLYIDDVLQDSHFFQWTMLFDGASGDVDMGGGVALDDAFSGGGSSEAWVSASSEGEGGAGRIFDKNAWFLQVRDESGGSADLRFFHSFSGDDGIWTTTNQAITIGASHHVVVTYDRDAVGNDPIIYIDGVSATITETSTPTGTAGSDAANNLIVGNRAADDRTFDGNIDEARLWDDVRTPTEIADNRFIKLTGSEVGLVGYWPMDIGSGSTLDDDTANSNDGTITTATWAKTFNTDLYGDSQVFVIDNSNDYQMFSNSAMPYVEFAKISVEGVLQLHYEFDDLPDHELTDRSGEGHSAIARYPDTIDGFTVALQSAAGSAAGGEVSDEAGVEVIGDFDVVDDYSDTPTTPGSGFILFDVLDIFYGDTTGAFTIPFQALTGILSMVIILFGIVVSAKMGLSHSLLISFVMISLLAFLWQMGGIPGWFAVLMVIPVLFFLQWKRMNP